MGHKSPPSNTMCGLHLRTTRLPPPSPPPLPLQLRRKKARLEMFYKFHHGLISINSKYLPKPSKSRLSSRNNNNQSYDIPTCTTLYRQMTFFPRTIPEWNKLPQEVVTAKSLIALSPDWPHISKKQTYLPPLLPPSFHPSP